MRSYMAKTYSKLTQMEATWLSSLLIFFLTTITILKFFTVHKRGAPKLPPGPQKLALIGNLHQLAAKNTLPHHRLAELARLYGPIMHLRLGEVPTVIISSASMAQEVMKTHDAVLCSRPTILVAQAIFYNCTDIAMSPYGEYWRQVRKIAVLELLTTKRVQSFRHVREEEVANLIKSVSSQAGSVVNLSKRLFSLTFDITTRLAFRKKGKDQEEFRALLTDIAEIASGFSIGDLYPSLKFLHSITGIRRKLQELVKASDRILDPIIDEHRSKKRQGKPKVEEDVVDILLTFHKDDREHDTQFSLTTENIKAIVLELFGAGSDTSSTTIEWIISELLKNPRVMEKAQDEVRRVFQGIGVVDETRLEELKYLKLVIKETLRLHPPFPLLLPRESIESCQIDSYEIPPKTRVIVNAWAIGRDPKYWLDPEKFNPERFEGSLVDYKGNHFELIPFGAGRRICPGIGLGTAIIELTVAMLLYHFDWKLPHEMESKDLNMDETFGIVARKKNELHALCNPYPSSLFGF